MDDERRQARHLGTLRYYVKGMPHGPTRRGRSALPWPVALAVPLAAACATTASAPRTTAPAKPPLVEEGLASWYGHPYHGRATASGAVYDMRELTAAHRTLPFGSTVRVVSLANGRTVVVTINDRGPFVDGRIIDLSHRAAEALDAVAAGVIPVRMEVLALGDGMTAERCWEVQVGAFAEAANVERAVARLRQRGFSSRTVQAPAGLTRVRATGMESVFTASTVAAALQSDFPGATAVPCGFRP